VASSGRHLNDFQAKDVFRLCQAGNGYVRMRSWMQDDFYVPRERAGAPSPAS
jgi:hypothetical protein